jgi:hypothetical protein
VGVRFVDPDEALRELIAWAIQRSLAAPEGA